MYQVQTNNPSNPDNPHHQQLFDLFHENRQELRQTVVRSLDQRISSRMDPSDVLQEACIEAIRGYEKFLAERPMPLFDWLRLITKNVARNANSYHIQTRKRSVKKEQAIDRVPDPLQKSNSTPSQQISRNELLNRKKACLNLMSPEENEIIRMRHQLAMSNDEIARRLGVTKKAASKRYLRAIRKLEHLMEWSAA